MPLKHRKVEATPMLMVLLVESAEAWDLSLSTCDTVTPVQGWQLKLGTHDGNSRYDLRFPVPAICFHVKIRDRSGSPILRK